MATHSYNTESQRIGKYKGQILGHAIPQEVSGRFGVKKGNPEKLRRYHHFCAAGCLQVQPHPARTSGR